MNGSTNVQISAIATFVSVTLLWLAGFFFPDLMATAPEMLGELFTGALIVVSGLVFKPDAGTKLLPGTGANSPATVGVLALILAVLMLSGCAGTRAAYKAADGLSETAYVVGEHYYALVRETNDLDDKGQLSSRELRNIQNIARETRPTIVSMLNAASAYDGVKSAQNETELSAALATAALAVSRLVDAIKEVGVLTRLEVCTVHMRRHAKQLDYSRGGFDELVDYCTVVASR